MNWENSMFKNLKHEVNCWLLFQGEVIGLEAHEPRRRQKTGKGQTTDGTIDPIHISILIL